MAFLYQTRPFSEEGKRDAVVELLDASTPDRDFYLLLIGAAMLAIFGIFLDSISVLIASMIVAPLAYPILALGLGLVAGDIRLAGRSFGMLFVSLFIVILLAFFGTFVFGDFAVDRVFISFTSDRTIATLIAFIAGAIAAYGLMRPKVGGAMLGIGIAVSLMPPLVATGIGVAEMDYGLISRAFILFMLNVGGILAGSIFVFLVFGINRHYQRMRVAGKV